MQEDFAFKTSVRNTDAMDNIIFFGVFFIIFIAGWSKVK